MSKQSASLDKGKLQIYARARLEKKKVSLGPIG